MTSFFALLFTVIHAFAQNGAAIDQAFQKFWDAKSRSEAEKRVSEVLKTGVSFDEALRRLKAGRKYAPQQGGVVMLRHKLTGEVEYHYAVNIPPDYDPARRYQVRFQLHGGVGRSAASAPRGNGEIGALAGAEQIYVLPYSWADAPWWGDDQVLNLNAIVDRLKRTYNVDENRVVVAGVSDGGTGAYYIAMRDTTPYAGFLPLNGFIMVLANPTIDLGQLYPNNLRNKPMFAVNGGQDPLYPASRVEPYIRYMQDNGVDVTYHPQPEAGHNTRWWPEVKDIFETFVSGHPRDPDPDELTWETGDGRHNRAHWLVIDKLGARPEDSPHLPDMNVTDGGTNTLFMRPWQTLSGRVDLWRKGNTIEAKTKGVSQFTLLLSPDKLDFNRPIRVIANGKTVFDGRVQPSVATLMKWAARDNDRTMLYAAELPIRY